MIFIKIGEVSNNIFVTNAMILSSVSTKFPVQEKLQGSVPQSEIEQVLLKLEAFNVVLCFPGVWSWNFLHKPQSLKLMNRFACREDWEPYGWTYSHFSVNLNSFRPFSWWKERVCRVLYCQQIQEFRWRCYLRCQNTSNHSNWNKVIFVFVRHVQYKGTVTSHP